MALRWPDAPDLHRTARKRTLRPTRAQSALLPEGGNLARAAGRESRLALHGPHLANRVETGRLVAPFPRSAARQPRALVLPRAASTPPDAELEVSAGRAPVKEEAGLSDRCAAPAPQPPSADL